MLACCNTENVYSLPLKHCFPSYHQCQIIHALKVRIPSCSRLYALQDTAQCSVSVLLNWLACFAINPNLGLTDFCITCFYLLYFIPSVRVFEVGKKAESFGLCYTFSLWEEVCKTPPNSSSLLLEIVFSKYQYSFIFFNIFSGV